MDDTERPLPDDAYSSSQKRGAASGHLRDHGAASACHRDAASRSEAIR